jgi:hypothetical protein
MRNKRTNRFEPILSMEMPRTTVKPPPAAAAAAAAAAVIVQMEKKNKARCD